jgi:hypothetical protein
MSTVFSVLYRPIGDPTLIDPNIHVIRELLIVDEDGILIVNDPAILCITAGDAGRYLEVKTNSTVEFG